jgi:hypothetical protein
MNTGRPDNELPRSSIGYKIKFNNGEERRFTTIQPAHPTSGIDHVLHADIPFRTPPKIGVDTGTDVVSKEASSMSSTNQTKLPESGRAW